MKKLLLITIASLIYIQASAVNDARMMRFPDINGDLIVFVYAGDIWTVNAGGGEAKTHPIPDRIISKFHQMVNG